MGTHSRVELTDRADERLSNVAFTILEKTVVFAYHSERRHVRFTNASNVVASEVGDVERELGGEHWDTKLARG